MNLLEFPGPNNSSFVLLLNLPIFVTNQRRKREDYGQSRGDDDDVDNNDDDDDDVEGIDDVEKGRDGWAGGSIVQDSGKGGACQCPVSLIDYPHDMRMSVMRRKISMPYMDSSSTKTP